MKRGASTHVSSNLTTSISYPTCNSFPDSMNGSQNANLCIPCGREYANIKQHNDDVHNPNKQPVTCPICEKTFASKNSMRVHKSTLHRE